MKIERVNENQIRCTLTEDDLKGRNLKISELAYGSDKARALFQDMLQQAGAQLGFEAEDVPLMIEAIPLTGNCIVILITKVEDPEELDTRFAKFSPEIQNEAMGDAKQNSVSGAIEALLNVIRSAAGLDSTDTGQDAGSSGTPGGNTAQAEAASGQQSAAGTSAGNQEMQRLRKYAYTHRLFVFDSMNELIEAAGLTANQFSGSSRVYAEKDKNLYYLVLVFNDARDVAAMQSVLALLSEYSGQEIMSYAREQYLKEHCTVLLEKDALKQLAGVSGN